MERFKVGQRVITAPHAWRWPNRRGTVVEMSYPGAAIVAVDGETREHPHYGPGEIVRAGHASTTGAARGGSLRASLQEAQERDAEAPTMTDREKARRLAHSSYTRHVEGAERRIAGRR